MTRAGTAHAALPHWQRARSAATPSAQDRMRIVVVGEFNSGKTTLVNALVGAPVLTPSCHRPHHRIRPWSRFAAKPSLSAETANRRRTPVAWDRLDDACAAMTSAGCMSARRWSA